MITNSHPDINQVINADASELVVSAVDLLIAASSWDMRCLAVTEVQWVIAPGEVFLCQYENMGSTGRAPAYAEVLRESLSRFGEVTEFTLSSGNPVDAWTQLKGAILGVYRSLNRPICVALDITSLSRYVWLNLLGFASQTGVIDRFEFIYSAAASYEFLGEAGMFSDGAWKPRAIATLGRGVSPSSESLLIVVGGFEGANTLRLVNALEPDRVLVALASDTTEEHHAMARRANSSLGEEYGLVDRVVPLPLTDIMQSVENLARALVDQVASPNRDLAASVLLCGSKMSALAVGLLALESNLAQIYFSEPQRRLETTASAVSWTSVVSVRF